MKKVLITGGAGFIGSALTRKLSAAGLEVTILDSLSPQIHGEHAIERSPLIKSIRDKAMLIVGSITSREDIQKAIEGQDIIVHFAAETGTGQSMYQIQRYVDVNIGGTALLLDVLAKSTHQVDKIIVASSRSVYGEGRYFSAQLGTYVYPDHRSAGDMDNKDFEVKYPGVSTPLQLVSTDEDSKIHPSSVYGITKQNQEQLVMTVCPTIGIVPVAFRYQNVYGPGQSLYNPYTGILSIFSSLIKCGKGINIFEDGKESRDFVFIDDVVEATYLGIVDDRANGEVFNVGTGQPTDVITVARTLVDLHQNDVPLTISGNYRLGDIRHNFASLDKIKSKLDFAPRFAFKEGIGKFTAWVNSQEPASSRYDESLEEMRNIGLLK